MSFIIPTLIPDFFVGSVIGDRSLRSINHPPVTALSQTLILTPSHLSHIICHHDSSPLIFPNPSGISNCSLKRTSDGQPSDGGAESESNKKKKPLTHERREDRNLREKERSLKITQQIHEVRDLLSMGGVIVPKVSSWGMDVARIYSYLLFIIDASFV